MSYAKRISIAASILVSLVFLAARTPAQALEWKLLHERADAVSYEDALAQSQKTPDSIDGLYLLGLVCLNKHKDREANEAFASILLIDPHNFTAQWGLTEVLRRRHQADSAAPILASLMRDHPKFPPVYITLAYIEYYRRNFDSSIRLANAVLRLGEDNVDVSNYTRAHLIIAGSKGMIAYFGGPLSKIINGTGVLPMLKDAERLQPDSPTVFFGLGAFYFMAPPIIGGNVDKGIVYLQKAIQADPVFADAYVRLAQAYRVKGDEQKYEKYLTRALEIDPANELALDVRSGQCRFICTPAN